MPRVVHFEIHVDDPARAIGFYRGLFGWEFAKVPGPIDYWLVTTGDGSQPGINGGMFPRRESSSGDRVIAYVCSVDVPQLDSYLTELQRLGGTVVVPKVAFPGVGWYAYAKDPEGNIFGLMQNDPSAK